MRSRYRKMDRSVSICWQWSAQHACTCSSARARVHVTVAADRVLLAKHWDSYEVRMQHTPALCRNTEAAEQVTPRNLTWPLITLMTVWICRSGRALALNCADALAHVGCLNAY